MIGVSDCIANGVEGAIKAAAYEVYPESGITEAALLVERVVAELRDSGLEIVPIEVADAAQRALLAAPRRYITNELKAPDGVWNQWRHERT